MFHQHSLQMMTGISNLCAPNDKQHTKLQPLPFQAGDLLKPYTLQITTAIGKTFWLTIIMLFLLVGIAEWIMRLDIFQAPLTPPKMGSRHYQLGHKLALLDAEIKENGPIDCIMVGSSMVDVGFDPDFFQLGYQEVTRQHIRCFNFGIDASSATSTVALVQILIEDYHPRLLIFGTDPRDYAIPSVERGPAVILDTVWVKHRLGDFSLDGWLMEHSYLYRYRQHLSRLIRFIFEGTLWSDTKINFEILSNGFTPLSKVSTYINDPPNLQDDSYEVNYYNNIYSSYQILDENLAALERIMDHNGLETQVIVVEMPVSDGLYYFFGNDETDYNRFISAVSEIASMHQIPFWRTEPLDSIPDDGWSDYSHLNTTGAEIFSTWLGQQVGEAEDQGSIVIFQP
jgi:hypothetical protein